METRRATMSDEPPGEKVTMTRMGFVGHVCAVAFIDRSKNNVRMNRSFISAPSVSRIAPGRTQERHVIVRRGVRDLEPDRHHVEESLGFEIGTHVEHELIRSGAQLFSLQERRVGAAVLVRGGLRNERASFAVKAVKLDR